jgi:hypothetical protein
VGNFVFQLCVFALVGWVNRGQQQVIEFLLEENRVLREQLGGRHLRLTDMQQRRLAVRAKAFGRKTLMAVARVVTPDTLLRWYRTATSWSPTPPKEAIHFSTKCVVATLLRSGETEPSRAARSCGT